MVDVCDSFRGTDFWVSIGFNDLYGLEAGGLTE